MQKEFINDAVVAEKQRTRYNDTLLPKYDASRDPFCASYFSKPFIEEQLIRKKYRELPVTTWRLRPYTPLIPKALSQNDLSRIKGALSKSYNLLPTWQLGEQERRYGSLYDLESIYSNKPSPRKPRDKSREKLMKHAKSMTDVSKINKLSYRRFAIPTPSTGELRRREDSFVNDAVKTERSRTKYRDLIPVYDAREDKHASGYHRRQDVKKLVSVTRPLKP